VEAQSVTVQAGAKQAKDYFQAKLPDRKTYTGQNYYLEVQHNLCAAAQRLALSITCDGEGSTGLRLPDVLLVVGVLCGHSHAVSHEVGGVKPYTELPNHGHISASRESLHEGLGATPGEQ